MNTNSTRRDIISPSRSLCRLKKTERRFFWGEDGHIHVKNLSAFWIPELTDTEVIHGTTYVVTGSYEGTENFVRKLERITSRKFAEKMEDSE